MKCRNSARINEAGLRGCPTGPSGAAEPAKKEVRDREGGFERRGGGAVEAVRLRASAARSSHGIAVRLSAVATSCRRVHAFHSTTLPSPPSSSWSWAHHSLMADRRPRLHLLLHASSGDGTSRSSGAWFQAPLLLPPLLRSYLCCAIHPLLGNFFHSDLRVDCNLLT